MTADNLSKLQENTRCGGPLTQELLWWLAANTAAGGREVTDTQGRCSTELLHLDGAFWSYCSFPATREASANDASSLGWTGPWIVEKQLRLTERVNENQNTLLIALWESDGAIICSASVFLERGLVDSIKEGYLILTCINNTGMKYVKNNHLLNTSSVPGSPRSASTPFPLLFRHHFRLLCPLATEHQPQWPPHCSLKTPSMLPYHGTCACSFLLSRSLFIHICAWLALSL